MVRFTSEKSAVEAVDSDSSVYNYHKIALFSLISRPIGSFAFPNWNNLCVEELAVKVQIKAFNEVCDSKSNGRDVSFSIIGERLDSALMHRAPFFYP